MTWKLAESKSRRSCRHFRGWRRWCDHNSCFGSFLKNHKTESRRLWLRGWNLLPWFKCLLTKSHVLILTALARPSTKTRKYLFLFPFSGNWGFSLLSLWIGDLIWDRPIFYFVNKQKQLVLFLWRHNFGHNSKDCQRFREQSEIISDICYVFFAVASNEYGNLSFVYLLW